MTKAFEIMCAGYSIMADWYEGKSTYHVILVLNGFTSSRSRQAVFTDFMVGGRGASALTIDYTGHGESPFDLKNTRPAQHVLEVVYAFDWIKTNYPNAKITVIGNSYGSFLAAHLTHCRSFENLVLRAPAIYKPESLYDLWSIRFNDEDKYRLSIQQYRTNSTELGSSPLLATKDSPFQGRVLVVVHENDEVVPRQTSDAYIEAFNADSFIAEGFNHAVSQSNISDAQLNSYHEQISNWLE
jgi:pimeloyl-ACP methyl ester carboxylesterase